MKIREWAALAAIASLAIGTAVQGEPSDDQFARKAASGGKMEVELGRYAAQHAESPEVRQLGQRIAQAHEQANQQLREVTRQDDLELPDELLPEHRQQVERLKRLEGAAFDRAYVDAMVKDHEKDLREFRKQAEGDSRVDRWAAQQVPVLDRHLEQARNVEQRIAAQPGERMTTPAALPRTTEERSTEVHLRAGEEKDPKAVPRPREEWLGGKEDPAGR